MLYNPIRDQAEFESRIQLLDYHGCGTPEDVHLDFKLWDADGAKRNQREFARDVAQFANTWGGTLVLGVHAPEDPRTKRDTGKVVVPIQDQRQAADWITKALSNYLYPAAQQPRAIFMQPWSVGSVAVLNVEPSDTMVAVWRQSEQSDGIENLYRTDVGKAWFSPEEAAMRMSNWSARAARIKMVQIIEDQRAQGSAHPGRVTLSPPLASRVFAPPAGWRYEDAKATADVADLSEDEFQVEIRDGSGKVVHRLDVPYHYVDFAWKKRGGGLALELRIRIWYSLGLSAWQIDRDLSRVEG